MIAITVLVVLAVASPFLIGIFLSEPGYKGPASDHFDGKQFINPAGLRAKGLGEVIKWMRERTPGKWSERRDLPYGEKPLPVYDKGVRVTFVNHSTFLLQIDGVNIITDPVWSERVSPFSFAGPRRMRPPGIRFEDLPKIDIVLLSHNHYDHLDINYVKRIHQTFNPQFVVPLGVSGFLRKSGITKVKEFDWWQSELYGTMKIEAVPAQHFSGRGILDRDATLWCGYVIHRDGGNVYFAGDTGYNDVTFREIGVKCKPALSLIPIGAYKPEWFMSPIHCSPIEAVQIHQDLNTNQSIATHFGTFPLADDSFEDPVTLLHETLKAKGIPVTKFLVLEEGTAKDFS